MHGCLVFVRGVENKTHLSGGEKEKKESRKKKTSFNHIDFDELAWRLTGDFTFAFTENNF